LELGSSAALAVDQSGDVYAAVQNDESNSSQQGWIVELTPNGRQRILPFKHLGQPRGVAVDGDGNVFVTVWSSPEGAGGHVVELSTSDQQRTLTFGNLSEPSGIAVDSVGNVYVVAASAAGGNEVLKLTPGGSEDALPFTPGSLGTVGPVAVAVDQAGEVFAMDLVSMEENGVEKLTRTGAAWVAINAMDPWALALDPAGDIFVTSGGNGEIVELPAPTNVSRTFQAPPALPRSAITSKALILRVDAPAKTRLDLTGIHIEPQTKCNVTTGRNGLSFASVSGTVIVPSTSGSARMGAVELWVLNRSGRVVGSSLPWSLSSAFGDQQLDWMSLEAQTAANDSRPHQCVIQAIDPARSYASPQR
jgi:DNA-binding beta-propeller fold protein YncE